LGDGVDGHQQTEDEGESDNHVLLHVVRFLSACVAPDACRRAHMPATS
jgi:hypothetical protein